MNALDWTRDVCERCSEIIEMPGDGSASPHVCIHDFIPWSQLREAGVARREMSALQASTHVATPLCSDVDLPARTGPFEPGRPPPLVLVGDLLLWTREDLLAVAGVGGRTVEAIVRWLERVGLQLAPHDGMALHLIGLSAWWMTYGPFAGYVGEDFVESTGRRRGE